MAAQSSTKPAAAQQDFSKVRHAPDKTDFQLTLEGHALLASIAAEARPTQLAEKFPRIVNRMATLWKSKPEMDSYFEELLTDTRGNRKGFPLGVLMELTTLKDYYQTKVFASATKDVWDPVERARLKA